jgi:hypothetical protein
MWRGVANQGTDNTVLDLRILGSKQKSDIKVIRKTVLRNNCSRCLLYLYFDRYMFRPSLAIIRRNTQYKEVIILTTDPLFVVQIVLCTLFGKC